MTPTLVVNNSSNVALYAVGAMSLPTITGAYVKVAGASNNILVAGSMTRDNLQTNAPITMLEEQITGEAALSVSPWPSGIAIYKRGTIDETPFVSSSPPPASPTISTVDVGPTVTDRIVAC